MLSIKLEEFIDTKNLDKIAELGDLLNEERLSAKDTGVHHRIINHWDEKGIIRFKRANKNSNRKFSFVDFIWIKIVNELRSFGVKIPVIQKIAEEMYQPAPMKEMIVHFADCMDEILKDYEGENKEEILNLFKSGEYKEDIDDVDFNFSYLYLLIAEAITTRKSASLIIFNDGEWFPFVQSNEHLYPDDLLYKKDFFSQVRINITEIIFNFILDDYLIEYLNGLHLFTPQERKLLYYIKEGDYKKVFVLFKSKKHEPIEIIKSKTAQETILRILREKEYREFILTDKKNNEFRIREEEPKEAVIKTIPIADTWKERKRKRQELSAKEQGGENV